MKIEMRDIEYFAAVAEHGHVGRAAEQLRLSQPAVSKSLRRLEESIQTKLVRRTPKGVDLTAVGAALFARARGLQMSLDDFVRTAAALSRGQVGVLRIGVLAGLAEHLLAPACSTLLKDAGQLTMAVTVDSHVALMPAMRRGEFDLVVGRIPAPSEENMACEHLYDDEFVFFASSRHRLAGRKRLTLADLSHEAFVSPSEEGPAWRGLRQAFEQRGLSPLRIALQTTSTVLRFPVIASSDLVGFSSTPVVRQAAPRYRLTVLPVKEWKWRRSVGVMYRKDAYRAPAALRFIEILKSTAGRIDRGER